MPSLRLLWLLCSPRSLRSPAARCLATLAVAVLPLVLPPAAWAVAPVDVVLHHGKVFTADPGRPWAEAIAIRGARIVAVGSNAAVQSLAGSGTRAIDLGGRLVVPGLNDAHSHLGVGFPRLTLPPIGLPGPGPSLAEAVAQVASAVAVAAPGEWILALVGERLILDPAATRAALDPVAPDNPVMLLTWSSHAAVINSKALAVVGIAEDAADPFGGFYGRFPDGSVNGVVEEYALFKVFRAVRQGVPDAVLRAQFEGLTALAAQLGVTSLQEMTIGLSRADSARVLTGANLAVRVRSMCVPLERDEPCAPERGAERLEFSGIKWLVDGTPIERSAALREPYADFPGSGHVNFAPADVARLVGRGLGGPRSLHQLLVHTVGDRALDRILGELERAAPAPVWRLRRPRIEHGDLLHPEQIERVRRLGAIVVQNPTHLALDYTQALGPDRAAAAQPLASLLRAGVPLALGSDAAQPNPFLDLFFAVVHPFHPAEALTMEQAVVAATRGAAAAEFEDHEKGTLRPGFLADLAVLSQDLFTVPPTAVPATTSLLTLVGGEVVWDAGVLPASAPVE